MSFSQCASNPMSVNDPIEKEYQRLGNSPNYLPILQAILTRTNQIYSAIATLGAKEMAAIDDLKAAVTAAVAEMQAAATLITNLANGTVNADDPAVEAQVAALNAATAALTTTVSPPPPPPPAPSNP